MPSFDPSLQMGNANPAAMNRSQIRFYADIDLKLDDYNEQLNEQQSVLDSTKQRVLKEGGTILN